MNLQLTRPLFFFDQETTGTNPTVDHIVSIAVIKIFLDGTSIEKEQLINPLTPPASRIRAGGYYSLSRGFSKSD
ncbi:MAG: hypothetical protein V4714_09490 [Bacteroidota bacterium]